MQGSIEGFPLPSQGRKSRTGKAHRHLLHGRGMRKTRRDTATTKGGWAMGEGRSILLVERDKVTADRLAGWLEDAGFDVLACPGPSAPGYRCVGSLRGSCPLVEPVDLVVLDL